MELDNVNEVHTANNLIDSPAMLVADYNFHTGSIYSKNYVDSIISYCKKNNIKMVISLLDLELTILSKQKKYFEANNIFLAISDYDVCKICNDKLLTQKFLLENNFPTVNMYLNPNDAIKAVNKKESKFPFFIKPRWGMGSIALYQANNENELFVLYEKVKKDIQKSVLCEGSKTFKNKAVIIQERLKGEEYGIDVLNDFDGNYVKAFVKKKIAMRSGETDSAITILNKYLENIGKQVSEKLGHFGNLDMDVFFDGKNAYVLELNPRFGGGYPFTHLAGGNIVKAYIDLFNGNSLNFNFNYNVKACKTISMKQSNKNKNGEN